MIETLSAWKDRNMKIIINGETLTERESASLREAIVSCPHSQLKPEQRVDLRAIYMKMHIHQDSQRIHDCDDCGEKRSGKELVNQNGMRRCSECVSIRKQEY